VAEYAQTFEVRPGGSPFLLAGVATLCRFIAWGSMD